MYNYIEFLCNGDVKGVGRCYGFKDYSNSSFENPDPIKSYEIIGKETYSQEFIDRLNKEGQMPSPPFQAGDIELRVKEIFRAAKSPVLYQEGQTEMYTYVFRKSGNNWFMTEGCADDQD